MYWYYGCDFESSEGVLFGLFIVDMEDIKYKIIYSLIFYFKCSFCINFVFWVVSGGYFFLLIVLIDLLMEVELGLV